MRRWNSEYAELVSRQEQVYVKTLSEIKSLVDSWSTPSYKATERQQSQKGFHAINKK